MNKNNNNNNDFNFVVDSSSDEDNDGLEDNNSRNGGYSRGGWQQATTTYFLDNPPLLTLFSRFLPPVDAIVFVETFIAEPEDVPPGFEDLKLMCKAELPKFDLYKSDFYSLCDDGSRQTISLTAEEIKEYKSVYEPFFGRLSWDFVEQDFV